MKQTDNSLSKVMADFVDLLDSGTNILKGFTDSMTTSADNVSVNIKKNDTEQIYKFPSFKYLDLELKRIKETLKGLTGFNGESYIKMPDGKYKKVFISKLLKAPDKITNLTVPKNFKYKNNWMFDGLMSPLLYFPINLDNYIDFDCEKVAIKRIIIDNRVQADKDFFNEHFNGQNNINYEECIIKLNDNNVDFFIDEKIEQLPPGVLKYEGTFDILRYEDVDITINNEIVKRRKYFLNKITYTDNLTTTVDGVELKVGDQLAVKESIFEITVLNKDENSIVVKQISGLDSPSVGVDAMRIYTDAYSPKTLQVSVGYDEHQIVFIRPIKKEQYITSVDWSAGIGFWSNDLEINTVDGVVKLDEYYRTRVTDLGQELLENAKQKPVSIVDAERPNVPLLSEANLEVTRINDHKLSDKEVEEIKKKSAEKSRLQSEIKEIEKSIDKKREQLLTTDFPTEADRRGVRNELNELINEKIAKSNLYATIIQELVSISQDVPSTLAKPKYRVRGFFPIPEPVWNAKTGYQYPIQFIVEYRYLKLDGSASNNEEFVYTNEEGQTIKGSFTNWTVLKSSIRKRIYDDDLGSYIWAPEEVENPDVTNINQIDIPITPGEKVEIRVKSVSEAGWPVANITSEYSESNIIEFPEEIIEEEELTQTLLRANEENVLVMFEQELITRGLDEHLATSYSIENKYIAHDATMIASGFFTPEGNVVDLYEKIKELKDKIQEMQAKLEFIRGELKVSIIDGQDRITVTNQSTVKLFAGYYQDEILELPEEDRKGAIITKIFRLIVENSESTPLELISRLPGGLSEKLPSTRENGGEETNLDDYYRSRKYDMVPIVNNSVSADETTTKSRIAEALYQSQQLKSQWLYCRYTDVGLKTQVGAELTLGTAPGALYFDKEDDDDRTFLPDFNGEEEDSNIWAGDTDLEDDGRLTDFCIHKDHPLIQFEKTYEEIQFPTEEVEGEEIPLQNPFKHAYGFNLSVDSGVNHHKQLSYKNKYKEESTPIDPITDSWKFIPDKFGFKDYDKYLVGKKTCGSYLYIAPSTIDQLLVDGTDYRAKRDVLPGEENAIEVPLIFQYRMTDYYGDNESLGIIGGYDTETDPAEQSLAAETEQTSLTYRKKIGIDIYPKDETIFNFDVEVTSKYQKETLAQKTEDTKPALSKSRGKLTVSKPELKAIT